MCYDIEEGHRRLIKEAIRIGAPIDQINEMIDRYNHTYRPTFPIDPVEDARSYHLSGFAHPQLDVIHARNGTIQLAPMQWGLIPHWCPDPEKARQIANRTINARSETMFDKPSFRKAARSQRGIILIPSFFEHHHANGKTYPFNIRRKDGNTLVVGVLWDEWTDRSTGEILKSFSIVTVKGNSLLARIHNNPKLNGPRMPLILEGDHIRAWLDPDTPKQKLTDEACIPYPEERLQAYPVARLRGKGAVGPGPDAIRPVHYPELEITPE